VGAVATAAYKWWPGEIGIEEIWYAVLPALAIGYVVGFLWTSVFIRRTNRRSSLEAAAGYVTLRRGYPELSNVDPATGLVVRKTGEPVLRWAAHRARIRRVRTMKRTQDGHGDVPVFSQRFSWLRGSTKAPFSEAPGLVESCSG
jgi:hypothetical protein